ncbi:ester cyclase [Sorangium sp. So ce118]
MKYTPEDNNRIAHLFFSSAWNKGAVLNELISEDAIDHTTVGGKQGGRGPESFYQVVSAFRLGMPDIHLDIEDEIAAADKVVHRWKMSGTDTGGLFGMPPSGKRLTFTGMTIARLENGKIVERWSNVDELGILQQLGVVPPPPSEG